MEEGKEVPEVTTNEEKRQKLIERNLEIKKMDVSDEEARRLMGEAMEKSGLFIRDEDGILEPIDEVVDDEE